MRGQPIEQRSRGGAATRNRRTCHVRQNWRWVHTAVSSYLGDGEHLRHFDWEEGVFVGDVNSIAKVQAVFKRCACSWQLRAVEPGRDQRTVKFTLASSKK
eukprot:TRINITY_DN15610_c0_g1_i1.p1 TRINITY_DN15610_c0_g1~~TRINITY_DN15610_c0_g1_i1.p1  ORF type:complete len:100 (-),score=3.42 TRINITY_DN15610_c0_g1_i1:12-311(-)